MQRTSQNNMIVERCNSCFSTFAPYDVCNGTHSSDFAGRTHKDQACHLMQKFGSSFHHKINQARIDLETGAARAVERRKKNAGIFARRAMVDQARQGLCYQRAT